MPPVQTDTRHALAHLALKLGAFLSLIIAAPVLIFDTEASPFFIRFRPWSNAIPLPLFVGLPAAVALGMGLGTQLALFRFNRHRLRAVFRPNPGRVLSSFALALLLPYMTFTILPVTNLYMLYGLAEGLKGPGGGPAIGYFLAPALGFPLLALPGSYLVSSLIISGIRSRYVRIALFGQVWLAVYSAILLTLGGGPKF